MISWAVIAGVVSFLVLMFAIGYDFWPAVILGLLVGVLVAILLWIGFHRDADEAGPASGAVPPPRERGEEPAPASPPAKEEKEEKAAGEAGEEAERKKTAPAAKRPEPAGKPEAKAEAGRPPALEAPRGGKPDDLKQIKGVGPKLEKMLNEMGIWHFDQIASWGPGEVAWMDANLKGFRGRVSRDGWVEQARALAQRQGEADEE
jgi:NADH-quinone oxidoreductase subunit E